MQVAKYLGMVCSAMVFLEAGCLLPPPVEEAEKVQNQPPRIEPDSLAPHPTDGPTELWTECENAYQFFATVTDPDVGDVIYWRRFIDYHQQRPATLTQVGSIQKTTPGGVIQFDIDAKDPLFDAGAPVETHIVELMISDRPFYEDTAHRPYGRAVEEGGLTDSFAWPIARQEGDCPQ